MRVLLDTHVWLWLLTARRRLPVGLLRLLADARTDVRLSAASSWEIALKHRLGKLPLPAAPDLYLPARMTATGVRALEITHQHALQVANLPRHHSDPFDLMLVAQAQVEAVSLVTADAALSAYDVNILWEDA